jgi:hypothetical protein
MNATMPRPKKKPAPEKKPQPVLFLRLDAATEAALVGYINSQEAPPDRTAVGLAALRQFLTRHGFWPPKS